MIEVDWDTPQKRIMRATLYGRWTWDEFYQGIHRANRLITAVEHPVFAMIHYADETARHHIPFDVLQHLSAPREHRPPNERGVIIVNPSRIARNLTAMACRLHPPLKEFFLFTETLDEARQRIDTLFSSGLR